MLFNNLFTFAIYLLVLISVSVIIKIIFQTITENKIENNKYVLWEERIASEQLKLKQINYKIELLNQLQESLLNRFFKITRDIILMQKLIFENYSK